MYTYVCIGIVCTHVSMYVHICMCVHMYTRMHACQMCVCMHVYMHVYIHSNDYDHSQANMQTIQTCNTANWHMKHTNQTHIRTYSVRNNGQHSDIL